MRIPVIRGTIDRRILINYRVDPAVLTKMLPRPFRPKLVNGMGMAGVCLIRLKQVRPRLLPGFLGISSENAAHRIAVEWKRTVRPTRACSSLDGTPLPVSTRWSAEGYSPASIITPGSR